MRQRFANLLKSHIRERGLDQKTFSERVGCDPSFVTKVVKGERLPTKRLERWADELELEGSVRDEFLEIGYLCFCPEYIQDLVHRLREEINQCS